MTMTGTPALALGSRRWRLDFAHQKRKTREMKRTSSLFAFPSRSETLGVAQLIEHIPHLRSILRCNMTRIKELNEVRKANH